MQLLNWDARRPSMLLRLCNQFFPRHLNRGVKPDIGFSQRSVSIAELNFRRDEFLFYGYGLRTDGNGRERTGRTARTGSS